MSAYWPWWLGALGLTGISLLYFLLIGRLLGVSGSWAKVVFWREQQKMYKENEALSSQGAEAINSTLLAETLAEFGEDAMAELGHGTPQQTKEAMIEKESRWTSHLTFLVSIFVGSLLASILTGHFQFRLNLSTIHSQIFGGLWEVWIALFFGGIMVGFGTQMAGGCTSGHGLSGSARMMPASLLSTFIFVTSAVSLSLVMKAFIS